MSLHDTIQQDANTVFCNLNDFAETATYHKRDGESRTISAVIVREDESGLESVEDFVNPSFQVYVANDCQKGISRDELDRGGDSIEFASVHGETQVRSIVRMLSHDEGMLKLLCR